MVCSNCGTENRPGRKFCSQCGLPLAATCPVCGAANDPGDRFCGECGTDLGTARGGQPQPTAQQGAAPPPPAATERRLVSVLFADLVGFTPLSESRDAEEVRDLLSRYFDTCSRLIVRYGGTVEKFIGDAVMAVWGTPVAQEDDAERAVRAALDLADAVSALGADLGAPELQARVGVLTGEAAVTIGATGQGMVAGDLVNTASRVQSVADPGTVLVGESTRRSTEAAIDYQNAGVHELKGKAEPVQLWRAVRVLAGVRGALKASGLEAPFVGRERELRLVKELFHASAEEHKAHLVSVVGIGGIGKSRLTWEFFKYIDGLADAVWWHRGRCLAYGEGVTYWALAEMVRMRARIEDGEEQASALAKLHDTVERHVPDLEEQRWIEPRLAHLLGLEERTVASREDLFGAWRLFFERLAESGPTIMVFEDMHWADPSLLEFIEYLLEWSRSHALYVMTLARPELADHHPNWASGKRNFTSLFLEPLSASSMEQLLSGLVPGLPDELRAQIMDRAEGVPLYAMETVRMLLDRGLLVQEGNAYRPVGPIEALDVPETLQALIAARLDGLTHEERSLLQAASVLGKSFNTQGLEALTGLPADRLDALLTSLLRKEVLSFQTDPRSLERGQYAFLQDLVKRVAYETLSKKERKAKHLAVAQFLETSWTSDEDEIVEILASHYLEAYRIAPQASDAEDLKAKACGALDRAGERAASLAATDEAQRYFEQALDFAADPAERARLAERAGQVAMVGARFEQAAAHFEEAIALFQSVGRSHPAARVEARLGESIWSSAGRAEEALGRMETAYGVLAGDEPDEDLATLAAQLGRLHWFHGDLDLAAARLEDSLEIAEGRWLPEVLSQALNSKSLLLMSRGRHEEAMALLKHALEIAVENDLSSAATRAYNNIATGELSSDRYESSLGYAMKGLELARKLGYRRDEWQFLIQLIQCEDATGNWDEAVRWGSQATAPEDAPADALVWIAAIRSSLVPIYVNRGMQDEAERALADLLPLAESSTDVQDQAFIAGVKAMVLQGAGNLAGAVEAADSGLRSRASLSLLHDATRACFTAGMQAALDSGDLAKVDELVGMVEDARPADAPPLLRACALRGSAGAAAARREQDRVEPPLKTAAGILREIGAPFPLATTLLQHGGWMAEQGRAEAAVPLLSEARSIFERLLAAPWLERVEAAERRGSLSLAAGAEATI